MDKILKKMGLSDTRHQLKFDTSSPDNQNSNKKNKLYTNQKQLNKSGIIGKICGCKQKSLNNSKEKSYAEKSLMNSQRGFNSRKQISTSDRKKPSQSGIKDSIKPSKSSLQPSISKRQSVKYIPQEGENRQNKNFIRFNQTQSKQTKKIQQLIQYLTQKASHKCLVPKHEQNKISYVCLEPNCFSRLGCSYCVLHTHQNHTKAEITTCVKDLQELSFKVRVNQNVFTKKIQGFYNEFQSTLQQQIKNIKQEFQFNITFLTMKVRKQFDAYFKQKYSSYLLTQASQQQKQYQNDFKDISEFDINPVSFNQTLKFYNLQKSSKLDQTLKFDKSIQNTGKLKQVKDKQMETTLATLDIQTVYEYLRKKMEILHFQAVESKVLTQFLQELNGSITHLFSAFKRNLPKIFVQSYRNNQIQVPKILKNN